MTTTSALDGLHLALCGFIAFWHAVIRFFFSCFVLLRWKVISVLTSSVSRTFQFPIVIPAEVCVTFWMWPSRTLHSWTGRVSW